MSKKRKVILPRWHSGRWLLSPDILQAYDEVWIHPADVHTINKEGDQSSYNEWEANNLSILRKSFPESIIVKEHPGHKTPKEDSIYQEAEELLHSGKRPFSRELAPFRMKDLVDAVIYAHKWWIKYNKQKLALLSPKEKLSVTLEKDLIPNWENRIIRLTKARPEEGVEILQSDDELHSTYTRLVAAAMRVAKVANHNDIFDYMLPEYIPMIKLLEKKRRFESGLPAFYSIDALQPIVKWQRIRRSVPFRCGTIDAWVERFTGPKLKDINELKTHLRELDNVLKQFPKSTKVGQEVLAWCQEIKARCDRIDRVLRLEKNSFFWLALVTAFIPNTVIKSSLATTLIGLKAIRLARAAPKLRDWWQRNLTGFLAGAYGLNARTGRFVLMMKNSICYSTTYKGRFNPHQYEFAEFDIEQHYWPFSKNAVK